LPCGCGSLDRSLFADTALLTRALRSRWATSIGIYAALLPLFMFAVYTRSGDDGLDLPIRVGISALAPLAGLATYAVAIAAVGRGRIASRSWYAPTLWALAGAVTALAASIMRSMAVGAVLIAPGALALSAVFTVLLVGVTTTGVASLASRQRQMRVLAAQQGRLIDMRAEAEGYVHYQSSELARIVEGVVSPEIVRLREDVLALDASADADRLQGIYDEIATYSNDVVRGISHEMSTPTVLPLLPDVRSDSDGRLMARIIGSARVNAPLTLLLALLLLLAQSSWGCLGVTSMAVSAFVVVTIAVGSVGLIGRLRRAPWSLAWLMMSAALGFLAYRLVLDAGPEQCLWASTPLESATGAIVGVVLFLGLTVVVEASMQAAARVEMLEVTNRDLSEITGRLNHLGLVTREQVAELLHGPVQGRLAAVSLAIRLHMDSLQRGEDPSLSELKRRVDHLLDETSRDLQRLGCEPVDSSRDVAERLTAVVIQWQGFLDLTVDTDALVVDVLHGHPDVAERLARCLDEAVTNASRHGGARRVMARCRIEEGSLLVLDVVDDGIGVIDSPTAGIGLESVTASGGVWQFVPVSGTGAHLRVTWIVH
jgi:signal transduction histidine kinase